jgi:hypothetical protein
MGGYKLIRIKSTGQVTEMVPDVARAMLSSGMADEVTPRPIESMAVAPAAERAVAPAQAGPAKKKLFNRGRG